MSLATFRLAFTTQRFRKFSNGLVKEQFSVARWQIASIESTNLQLRRDT